MSNGALDHSFEQILMTEWELYNDDKTKHAIVIWPDDIKWKPMKIRLTRRHRENFDFKSNYFIEFRLWEEKKKKNKWFRHYNWCAIDMYLKRAWLRLATSQSRIHEIFNQNVPIESWLDSLFRSDTNLIFKKVHFFFLLLAYG